MARQRVFFSYGEAAMKPLALQDIATELARYSAHDEPTLKLLMRGWQAPASNPIRRGLSASRA